jgi:uncharacterized pyridoxamine 5'-phosphate oxidase family protein
MANQRGDKMQEVHEFLKDAEHYFLATAEGDQPRVRPFGTYGVFEGKLYIQTGKVKSVAKQILKNPKIEISAFKDGKWIRIEAEAIEDDRLEAREAIMEQFPQLKDIGYSVDDGNMVVFYLKNAKATFSAFGAEARVVEF